MKKVFQLNQRQIFILEKQLHQIHSTKATASNNIS